MTKLSIAVRSHFQYEDIKNLLDSASRGASYWAVTGLAYESEMEKALTDDGVEIQDIEVGDDVNPKIYVLNAKKIKRGLTAMAKKEPSAFADFIKGDVDNNTGDTFLQCCIFGKVIYG